MAAIAIPGGDWGAALVVGLATMWVLAVSELARRRGADPEVSRKIAHMGAGLLCLTFPYLFSSPWSVLILSLLFLALVIGGRILGLLDGVHGVERVSFGAYAFPVVIAALFFLAEGDALLFQIPVLVLTLADSAAALIGKGYGQREYTALGEMRTFEGSAAFFVATLLCVHLPLLLSLQTGRVESVLIAFNVAVLVTCFEAISVRGLDNLFIPVGAWYALHNFLRFDRAEHVARSAFMAVFGFAMLLLARQRVITRTAAIGAFLAGYAAFSLGGEAWFRPLAASFVLLVILTWALIRQAPDSEPVGLSRLFQVAVAGVAILFLYDATDSTSLYVPYLAAVSGGTCLMVATLTLWMGVAQPLPWALGSAVLPPLAAGLWPGGPAYGGWAGLAVASICGALTLLLALRLAPTAARFRCTVCGVEGVEPRCCATPTELVAGRREWTESRMGLASISATALLAMVIATALS